jgi:MerR family transcriptional regulator, repressor of the yfmOP operon
VAAIATGTAERPRLLGIGEAASRTGVSERALRYYQQLGLITPSGTPGGLRRYSEEDVARVVRVRDLQHLLGLNLEEIGAVLANDDRLAALRAEYQLEGTDAARRRELIGEGLEVRSELRATVDAKLHALHHFLDELDSERDRLQGLLDDAADPPPPSPAA